MDYDVSISIGTTANLGDLTKQGGAGFGQGCQAGAG